MLRNWCMNSIRLMSIHRCVAWVLCNGCLWASIPCFFILMINRLSSIAASLSGML
ncbi:hypothetical protein NEOLEDRAFT_1222907 [Neolentinus lepideus HHB14362 ss-1]|uniref:Uncharacterized protein n=1 Tax=Neolentinus lepideus HHB14362 ss-1 TaxID=1314782 RepID=A0A165PX04_9AGAM|nr:hypothetical protein NEOLEDRAFT_1222907 [Neolentinus lepideus HHB14362 ss-1]